MSQHLRHLRRGEPILKPVYQHADGTFGPPVYVEPQAVHRRRGPARLPHAGHARLLRRARLPRAARGPAPQVEGPARLLPARLHHRPGAGGARPARARLGPVHPPPGAPRRHGRLVQPAGEAATRTRSTPSCSCGTPCPNPTSRRSSATAAGITLDEGESERHVNIPAASSARRRPRSRRRSGRSSTSPRTCAPTGWASSRSATTLRRSESLALVQLLILYHLVTAKAADALGGAGPRVEAAAVE